MSFLTFCLSYQYALNLELHKTSRGFRIHAACRADAMSAEDLKNTLLKFEQLFRNIVIHPENSCCEDIPSSTHPDVEKRSPVPTIPNGVHRPEFEALNQLLASISGLAIEHLHPDTNLIALGIDSINAIQLASKARHLGFSLRAQDVVQSRTVEDLYNKCGSNQNPEIVKTDHAEVFITGEEAANVTSLIKAVNADSESLVESITFASPGMKWLAGAWQKSRGSRFQHAFAYRLQKTIKAEDVHRAWRQLLDRHAILRSTIVSVPGSGQPRIVTFKSHLIDTDLTWSEVSLSEMGSPQKIVLQDMKELISNPPSLRQPPTRAKFFNSREGNFLVLYMNHFQYDAWSLQLLVDDLARLISGHDVASTNDLLGWLQATVPATDSLAEQEQYWRTIFPSPPKRSYLLVSSSIPSTDKQQSTERIVSTKLDALPLASSLQVRARQLNVSLQAVLLAAWTKVQARYTKSDAITFGLWHAGRSGSMIDGGLERLAVPCMNVLPFHVSEITEESMLQVALRIQDDLRRRSPVIEQTDLEKVDEWVGGGGKPLCNVYINVIKVAPEVGGEHSGLLSSVEVSTGHRCGWKAD